MKTTQADHVAMATEVLRTSRRRLMCWAAGAGAVATLAACGGSSDSDTGADSGSDPGTGSGEETTTGGEPGGEAPAGESIAAVADIPVGGGVAVGGLVLLQPEEGTVVAFDAACPHQGVQVAAPEDGVITCPAHGSQFSATDGSLVQGPATAGLTEVPVTVTDGEVFKA